ncbi:hypothetical protein [Mucilaginibacter kameinonensis]|uniref:hypothetical protein n=1 Tax=Mucilaginibacter kameinonensis TaxID=452286 RepID=UPI0013CEFB32|nr:hypothetical protein [Mucilaginibacter kameinonensis]
MKQKIKQKTKLLPEKGGNKKGSLEVPFIMNDFAIIKPGRDLYKMMHLLRRRAEEELAALSIPLTLKKTIRNSGLSELVFLQKKKFVDYILLIDVSFPDGAVGKLYEYLARLMLKTDVRLTIYKTDYRFHFKNIMSGAEVNMMQLLNNHPNSLPILMGDASNLFYTLLPIIRRKYLSFFNSWETRVVITPVPRAQWGIHEKILTKHFLICSADETDILQLVQKLHLSPEQQDESSIPKSTSTYDDDMENVSEAFNYLENDPFLTQWLCAIAIYPKFRWELMLAGGQLLEKNYKNDNGTSYANILKLCRIPWLRRGSIPFAIRLELLKHLTVENEIAVRLQLIKMLESARLAGTGFFYDSELEDQLITNKFILYVHNPEIYHQYYEASLQFKNLWKDGRLLDSPLRIYLENNEEEQWQTPLQSNGTPLALNKYFDAISKTSRTKVYYKVAACFLLCAVFFAANFYLRSLAAPPAGLGSLFSIKPGQMVNIKYKIEKFATECDTRQGIVSDLTGAFLIKGKTYLINYDSVSHEIRATVPYDAVAGNQGKAILNMDSGNPSYVENNITLDTLFTNGIIRFTCHKKSQSPSRPDSLASLRVISEIWQGGTSKRLINIDAARNVIYYSIGNESSFGTYNIAHVTKKAGVYKIITQTQNQGYKLFFIKNFKQGESFDLSVCQNFAQTQEELQTKDTSYCDHFNTMRLYYPNDPDKIFYPAVTSNTNLATSQRNKLIQLISNSKTNLLSKNGVVKPGDLTCDIIHFVALQPNPNSLSLPILNAEGITLKNGQSRKISNPSPFQRDYDIVTLSPLPNGYRILWVDDHPRENNINDIHFFERNHIIVDTPKTNQEAYNLLNKNIYSYIITDIVRDKDELPCVLDKSRGGLSFVSAVNFPKQFIIICSPEGVGVNKGELLASGIPENHLNADKDVLRKMVMTSIGNGNKEKHLQTDCNAVITSQLTAKYDTIHNSYLGYKTFIMNIRGKIYVNTPLKKYGIDLSLTSKPSKNAATFHYQRTDGCSNTQGDIFVPVGKQQQLFNDCNLKLIINLQSIENNRANFDVYIEDSRGKKTN